MATETIRKLAKRRGTSDPELQHLVETLQDDSWAAKTMEEDHGPQSVTRKYHPNYGHAMQSERSFAKKMQVLVTEPQEDKVETNTFKRHFEMG